MTVAPSGSHISLIDEKGYLWLGTVDFKVQCISTSVSSLRVSLDLS